MFLVSFKSATPSFTPSPSLTRAKKWCQRKLKEVTFDSSEFKVNTDEQPALDSEIANMVDGAVV